MRRLTLLVVALCLLTLPASAAEVDPKMLVLRQTDVPAGFRLDRDNTGLRSNATESRSDPRIPGLFERWGRVSGYQIEFDRGAKTISSRIDVFRTSAGAREFLAWYDREVRKLGFKGLRRAPARVGSQSWVYRTRLPMPAAIVVWRHGRVFAGIAGVGLTKGRTLALARVQQQRIAAALR